MQALSRQREPQKLVWSGWKEIIGGGSSHRYGTEIADSQGDAERHAPDA